MYDLGMSSNRLRDEADEAIRQFAKNFIRERSAEGERPAQLARRLGRLVGKPKGFARATMTEIMADRRGTGDDMKRALAKELFNGSRDLLERNALEWWTQNKDRILAMQRGKHALAETLYPNRGEALDRMDGAVSPAAIELVKKMRLPPEQKDLTILKWVRLVLAEHDRLSVGADTPRAAPTRRKA